MGTSSLPSDDDHAKAAAAKAAADRARRTARELVSEGLKTSAKVALVEIIKHYLSRH